MVNHDDTSVVPWKRGKILVWDATCVDTLAPSHRVLATSGSGAVADDAEHCKKTKYSHLEATHFFTPVAVETLGASGQEALSFLKEVAHRMKSSIGDLHTHQYNEWQLPSNVGMLLQSWARLWLEGFINVTIVFL